MIQWIRRAKGLIKEKRILSTLDAKPRNFSTAERVIPFNNSNDIIRVMPEKKN